MLLLLDRLLAALPLLLPYLALAIVYALAGLAARDAVDLHATSWNSRSSRARWPRPGELARRGEPLTGQFSLYPYLTAPAWFFDDTKSGYEAAKLIGVLGMTLAFFPAYGLARFVVSRPAAILAALGATMIPALRLHVDPRRGAARVSVGDALLCTSQPAGTLTPTRRVFAAAVAAAAVAPLFRDELVVVPVILARRRGRRRLAAPALTGDPRRTGIQRSTSASRPRSPSSCYFAEQQVTARSVEWRTVTRVFPERLLEYGVWAAGAFTIGIAMLPVVAALAFLVPGRQERRDRGVDALRVVLGLSILGFGALHRGEGGIPVDDLRRPRRRSGI